MECPAAALAARRNDLDADRRRKTLESDRGAPESVLLTSQRLPASTADAGEAAADGPVDPAVRRTGYFTVSVVPGDSVGHRSGIALWLSCYPYVGAEVRRISWCQRPVSPRRGKSSIPKAVRDALGLGAGDAVVFRIDGQRAVLARTRDLLDLAGSVTVPVAKRSASWEEARSRTRASRAAARR